MVETEGQVSTAEEILRERIVRARWGLFGQWWCLPLDCTPEETDALLAYLRDDLGPDFAACPLRYIEDRLYGGFGCENGEQRRHVYFAVGEYSFLAAQEGRYWAQTSSGRRDTYETLLKANANHYPRDGPFTSDAPAQATA